MNNIKEQTLENFNKINKSILSYPFTLIFMNIRSLRKNFSCFLVDIEKVLNEIKVIILVETNITDNENELYGINGFKSLFLNRNRTGNHKSEGGIAIYIKETIESLQLNLNINNETFTLLSIYRPLSQNVNNFITELEQTINKTKDKQEMIVVGDINIDIKNQNITTTKYLEMLSSHGFICMLKESTREDTQLAFSIAEDCESYAERF